MDKDKFRKKMWLKHGKEYDFDDKDWNGFESELIFTHDPMNPNKEAHQFKTTPKEFISNLQKCTDLDCNSYHEDNIIPRIKELLDDNDINYEYNIEIDGIEDYSFDFYIEFDGRQIIVDYFDKRYNISYSKVEPIVKEKKELMEEYGIEYHQLDFTCSLVIEQHIKEILEDGETCVYG
jgi:predicted transcriptional regulator YdeE